MRSGRLQVLAHAQKPARQRGGDRQIRVCVNAGESVFDPQISGIAVGHAECRRAVIKTPAEVDGGRDIGCQPSVGVHVRRVKTNELRRVALQATHVLHHCLTRLTLCGGKQVLTRLQVDDALMDVQRGARLTLHGLGHEGGIHVVALRRLAHRSFENKDLVCHGQRVAVIKINLQLRGAVFVDQCIDIKLLLIGKIVHVFDKVLELRNRVDTVGQARHLPATRATFGRHQLVVGVRIFVHQVKLDLGRHNRLEACFLIKTQNITQHVAGRQRVGFSVSLVTISNDLSGGLSCPRDHTQRGGIGPQQHVGIGGLDKVPVIIGIFTRHGLHHDRLGQFDLAVSGELMRGNKFTPRIAGHIRHQALYLGNFMLFQPGLDGGHICGWHLRGVVGALGAISTRLFGCRFQVRLTHNAPRAVQHGDSIGWRHLAGKRHNASHEWPTHTPYGRELPQ